MCRYFKHVSGGTEFQTSGQNTHIYCRCNSLSKQEAHKANVSTSTLCASSHMSLTLYMWTAAFHSSASMKWYSASENLDSASSSYKKQHFRYSHISQKQHHPALIIHSNRSKHMLKVENDKLAFSTTSVCNRAKRMKLSWISSEASLLPRAGAQTLGSPRATACGRINHAN